MSLGQFLVKEKFVTAQQIDDALNSQVIYGGRLGTNLLEIGALDERNLAKALSKFHRVKALDPMAPLNVRPDAFDLISRHFARKYNCIPLWMEGQKLYVATSDPRNQFSLEAVARVTGRQIVPLVLPEIRFYAALEKFYNVRRELRYVTLSMKLIERERRKKAAKTKPKAEEAAARAAVPSEDLMSEEVFGEQMNALQKKQGTVESPAEGEPLPESHPFGAPETPVQKAPPPQQRPSQLPPRPSAPPPVQRAPAAPAGGRTAPPPAGAAAGASMPPDPNTMTQVPFASQGVQVIDRAALARAEAESAEEILDIDEADIIELEEVEPIEEVVVAASAVPGAPEEEEILEADEEPAYTKIDLPTAQQIIAEAKSRDDIARAAVSLALSTMSRTIIFMVKGNLVLGWDGAGEHVDRDTVKSLVVPLTVPSAFKFVHDTRAPFVGPLPATETNDKFLQLLGGARPKSSVLFPILFRGRVVNVIYGDSGPGKFASTDISDLQILSPRIPATFEKLITERKKKVQPNA